MHCKERTTWLFFVVPELDIAGRGDSIEEARKNLQEAVTGHLQTAEQEEMIEDIYQ
jgi:predicted RNase H-like HicB family nuclease